MSTNDNLVYWRIDICVTLPQRVYSLWSKWCQMATQNWVNIGSGNGLMTDGTTPLAITRTDVDFSSVRSNDSHMRKISRWQPSITKIAWVKIYRSKILPESPRTSYKGCTMAEISYPLQCLPNNCSIRTSLWFRSIIGSDEERFGSEEETAH